MVRDAEGASKDIAVEVVGAATEDDALEAARAVGRSNLLKCALHGQRPQLGPRAVGRRHHVRRLRAGRARRRASTASRSAAAARPATTATSSTCPAATCAIVVDLHAGTAAATVWTSDLTAEYVHENSAYST